MRINPENFVFGVQRGKFLGFMLTNRGIEANLEKSNAIIEMRSPTNLKEVQRLTESIQVPAETCRYNLTLFQAT